MRLPQGRDRLIKLGLAVLSEAVDLLLLRLANRCFLLTLLLFLGRDLRLRLQLN